MNYRRDNKGKKIGWMAFFLVALILVIFYRQPIAETFSATLQSLGRLIWRVQEPIETADSISAELKAKLSNYETLFRENLMLKEIFYRLPNDNFILAAVLSKPNRSPYDTLIVDLGDDVVAPGQRVFAYGNVLIGQIDEVYEKTARIKLFSTPKERVDAVLGGTNIFVQALGRGGQNFEVTVPQGLAVEEGAEVVLPGITPYTLGIVQEIVSDPREPFKKLLLRSPVNIQELKFVEVEIQK